MHDDLTSSFQWQLNSAANSARQEDAGSLKYAAIDYLPPNPQSDRINPPIMKSVKCVRGFSHPTTARLLCPMKRVDEFDRDSAYTI